VCVSIQFVTENVNHFVHPRSNIFTDFIVHDPIHFRVQAILFFLLYFMFHS